jgi:hypothetical protein
MMSLRNFHLVFILIAILGADLFGLWSVWYFTQSNDVLILSMGIVSILGGLGLIWYAVRLVRRLDAAGIH